MRSIFFLALFGALLLQAPASFAETAAECQTRCADEKAARDAECQPGNDDEGRAQCLQESQAKHAECLNSCPQPEASEKPAEPAEN